MCVCVCVWMVDDCVDPLLSFVRWNCEFRSLPQAILHYFVFYLCVHIVDSSTNKWIYLCVQPSHRRRRGREMPVSTYHIIKCMYFVYLYISLRRSFALSICKRISLPGQWQIHVIHCFFGVVVLRMFCIHDTRSLLSFSTATAKEAEREKKSHTPQWT